MTVSRRNFLRGAAAGCTAAAASVAAPAPAEARGNKELPPEAVGLLFDATMCVGCKACVVACKEANGLPIQVPMERAYEDPSEALSPTSFNIIKMFKEGEPKAKDTAQDGFSFIKRSCMHCVDPGCVSACPVNAMTKDARTGVVSYNADACIGCRYCVMACPFGIPKFDYDKAVPEIHKCQLCNHLWKDGRFSACADVCPTGATIFGPVTKLLAEAKRRQAMEPGTIAKFPRRSTETGDQTKEKPAAKYVDHIYGEKEGGGTQMLMLSGVPFDKLGLPTLPERSYASMSETVQHTLYDGLIAPAAVLGGLLAATYRSSRKTGEHKEQGDE
ncbi:hydrogenase 2 operon protein HybA [Azospirillum sp. sgz301742]